MTLRTRAIGMAMVLAGGALLSLAGIVLRHIESASGWQILLYRSLSFTATLVIFLALRYRSDIGRRFVATGRSGLAVAVLLGTGSVCYVFGVLLTTVANVVFVISTAPLFTALLAWYFLGERIALSTAIAMLAACAGIGLMFADGLTSGGLLGVAAAAGVMTTQAAMIVVVRGVRERDMTPAICMSGPVTATIALAMGATLSVPLHDMLLSIFLGAVQFGGGFLLIILGTRQVPATEVALLALSEPLLAPLWVWLGIGERPSTLTLAGGAVVLVAVLARTALALRAESDPHPN